MSSQQNLTEVFTSFQDYLNEDHDTREEIKSAVRDLEQTARDLLAQLQGIHHGIQNVKEICEKCSLVFVTIKDQFKKLTEKVPENQYYRYHDHWRFVIQRVTFLASCIYYLETGNLITREEVASKLGVHVNRNDGFHLDLDDYLMGILQLASELARLAVNAVTAGDYEKPIQISKFVSEVDAGFRLLNLKNDALRKRFDGLKYDLKKIEGVVYDLSIRGLKPGNSVQDT